MSEAPVIGVLALQGDVREHVAALAAAERRRDRSAAGRSWTPSTGW